MALMFPRVASNFAKNGYYPTDEPTLLRVLAALAPTVGPMSIVDTCAGEGVAIAEVAHALGADQTRAFAVEYDTERARHARRLVYRCLHGDLMQTVISRRSFGLAWLNPPYGDVIRDEANEMGFKGRARLEKLFYQRTLPLLQYEGVLVLIVPHYVLDDEFSGWLTHHLDYLRIFRTVDSPFKQVVLFGRRLPPHSRNPHRARELRQLLDVGRGDVVAPELPAVWTFEPYIVPSSASEPDDFYQTTIEPEQFAMEVHRLQGLWTEFDTQFGSSQRPLRRPARPLSRWHLALALAGGAISGVIRSKAGRVLVVKGHTHKEKAVRTEFTEDEDGSVLESQIHTDKFVSAIRAWDVTPGSPTKGQVLTIR